MKQEAARRRKQGCSPSAISRYLVSNFERDPLNVPPETVSIRYIAVLGFQRGRRQGLDCQLDIVSIRYVAVLGFQHLDWVDPPAEYDFVSIRYIAVLGFQRPGANA